MSHTVAVDIGGTHIRVAVYEPDSITPVAHQRTRSLAKEPGVYDRLEKTIETVWPQDNVRAIGIASPGPLDPHTGTILATPNIPEWQNFPLTSKLSRHFGVPAYLDNDANMAGLAEWQFGAGTGHQDIVYLTISTGIGGGVISQGCLLQGFRGMGAELGHLIIDPKGPFADVDIAVMWSRFVPDHPSRATSPSNSPRDKSRCFSHSRIFPQHTLRRRLVRAMRLQSRRSNARDIIWGLLSQIIWLFSTRPF